VEFSLKILTACSRRRRRAGAGQFDLVYRRIFLWICKISLRFATFRLYQLSMNINPLYKPL